MSYAIVMQKSRWGLGVTEAECAASSAAMPGEELEWDPTTGTCSLLPTGPCMTPDGRSGLCDPGKLLAGMSANCLTPSGIPGVCSATAGGTQPGGGGQPPPPPPPPVPTASKADAGKSFLLVAGLALLVAGGVVVFAKKRS